MIPIRSLLEMERGTRSVIHFCFQIWKASILIQHATMVSMHHGYFVSVANVKKGMGNRFRGLSQYHSIVRAHGVLAAITFLGLVPAAIMIARFYHRNPRLALRLHIWLQISTVFMATVVFVLGWFAVGPERSLSNPHHSIGLTIYVLIIVQVIGGWWVHHREKKKMRYKLPIKLMVMIIVY